MTTFFPNPVEHAFHLLGACNNDIEQARCLARENALYADSEREFDYWYDVRNALLPKMEAQA